MKTVSVPSVVSDTVAQATNALQAAGLTLGTQTTASSATVPSGEIISQSPVASTSAASGSAVAVVVSSGPAAVSVPNVVSDTVAQATSALQAAGLTLGTQTLASSTTVPSGEIISQNPAASTSVSSGSAVAVVVSSGPALRETVLYSFAGGKDGSGPSAGLVAGSDGSLYGTTNGGGTNGDGTVFKITPAGVETVLYSFAGGKDGSGPSAALVLGSDGSFYGTTSGGGTNGDGTVFKITPAGAETVLYAFAGGADGATPMGALIQGSDGNFYGTTEYGGQTTANGPLSGNGTVFKVTPAGVETVLHAFAGGNDGYGLYAGLIQASDGNFYGTTTNQGAFGGGTAFQITPAGVETVLYSFGQLNDDGQGARELIQGSDGNFYGTTVNRGANGRGTVFKITPAGVETVLYSFATGSDGSGPYAGLIRGSDGNFYGTTHSGGASGNGTLFRITPAGVETVLHSFAGGVGDGADPQSTLIQGSDGSFYGTTVAGGTSNVGTVFKLGTG